MINLDEIKNIKYKFLTDDPVQYVCTRYRKSQFLYILNKILFIAFNIWAILVTFAIISVTTIVVSKTIVTFYPYWYFYWTTGITACLSFITSLFNFFYIKKNVTKYNNEKNNIFIEIIRYKNNDLYYEDAKDKDFMLFHKVNEILRTTHALRGKNEK